jgi:UDP-GlcNAc:undecaprenyl-phosphate GlcNAc-1-phosphate transferase
MTSESWTTLLVTAGVSIVICLLLTPMAQRFGLLDHPSDRKVHRTSTPLVSGPAIYIALVLGIILWLYPGAAWVTLNRCQKLV